jgi:CheY-like chemotaxis protein
MLQRRILLAEDDRDDQQFFYDFLKFRNDISLMPVAEDGAALVATLENITADSSLPHLIILDHNMPKMNGLQTLRFLKENKRYSSIPVMIYSTFTDKALIEKAVAAGACLVLPKPVTKEGYDKMINDLLSNCG